MKLYSWTPCFDGETHSVTLKRNRFLGKATVTIDDSSFPIKIPPLFIPKRVTQIFRLGEKQAILVIPAFGDPDIVIDRKFVGSGKNYIETKN